MNYVIDNYILKDHNNCDVIKTDLDPTEVIEITSALCFLAEEDDENIILVPRIISLCFEKFFDAKNIKDECDLSIIIPELLPVESIYEHFEKFTIIEMLQAKESKLFIADEIKNKWLDGKDKNEIKGFIKANLNLITEDIFEEAVE